MSYCPQISLSTCSQQTCLLKSDLPFYQLLPFNPSFSSSFWREDLPLPCSLSFFPKNSKEYWISWVQWWRLMSLSQRCHVCCGLPKTVFWGWHPRWVNGKISVQLFKIIRASPQCSPSVSQQEDWLLAMSPNAHWVLTSGHSERRTTPAPAFGSHPYLWFTEAYSNPTVGVLSASPNLNCGDKRSV